MPRLPTIRVIGSQDISTSCPGWAAAGRCSVVVMSCSSLVGRRRWAGTGRSRPVPRVESGGQRLTVVPPLRLAVGRGVGDAAHAPDERAVGLADDRGEAGA